LHYKKLQQIYDSKLLIVGNAAIFAILKTAYFFNNKSKKNTNNKTEFAYTFQFLNIKVKYLKYE